VVCLSAENRPSVLICHQTRENGAKDDVVTHDIGVMDADGRVIGFKQASHEDLVHDRPWRRKAVAPTCREAVIISRSHGKDVLKMHVHDRIPKKIWSMCYGPINDIELHLHANDTYQLTLFLPIGMAEQRERFSQRLDDPTRDGKISEADCSQWECWSEYDVPYQDTIRTYNVEQAPWFAFPADNAWFPTPPFSGSASKKRNRLVPSGRKRALKWA
jgi:polyphosphate kinase 2 (PPK2 family)